MASFATLATRNLTTVLAGILIFSSVFGLTPVRAFLFCFTNLPKPGRTNFAVLFDRFVGEGAERIKEYSSGSFVGLRGRSDCDLKFSLGHLWPWFMAAKSNYFKKPRAKFEVLDTGAALQNRIACG
jgi:hypothetical protein